MPLRDHFHAPLANRRSYQEVHGLWPGMMTLRLNSILPPGYHCGPNIRLGTAMEVDVGAHDSRSSSDSYDAVGADPAPIWAPASSILLLDTDEWAPPEYEVLVYDDGDYGRLVAAVELVSPGNKDRPQSREAFVSKCHTLLRRGVCLAIVDPVTDHSANLYAELAERIGAEVPSIAEEAIYAVSCRAFPNGRRTRVDAWPHKLTVGLPLPTLPLWLNDDLTGP